MGARTTSHAWTDLHVLPHGDEGVGFGNQHLRQHSACTFAGNFAQWIVNRIGLTQGNDSGISRHGVLLLSGGSGRLDTRLDTPPSIKRRHPVCRISLLAVNPRSPLVVTSRAAAIRRDRNPRRVVGLPCALIAAYGFLNARMTHYGYCRIRLLEVTAVRPACVTRRRCRLRGHLFAGHKRYVTHLIDAPNFKFPRQDVSLPGVPKR
jgi:hypothetical protein